MKYNNENIPIKCYLTQSTWFSSNNTMSIKGILWHSTGANNPNICRYVQPSDNVDNKDELLDLIGRNYNRNDWNHITYAAGVNAFIGKLNNKKIATVQTGPWNKKPWGCGNGSYGSCNDGWIQFEICEDNLCDKYYFDSVYEEACQLTAYLCKLYNINPKGTVIHNGIKVPTILCHADSCRLGLGSNHGDVLHWFAKFGKTMDDVRNDVFSLLCNDEEDEDMTQEKFNEMFTTSMNLYRKSLQDNDSGNWSKDDREWAIKKGLFKGSGNINGEPNYMWEDLVTREQIASLLHRLMEIK